MIQSLVAEDGYEAWLRYRPLTEAASVKALAAVSSGVVMECGGGTGAIVANAAAELVRGLSAMAGRDVPLRKAPAPGCVVLSLADADKGLADPEAFRIEPVKADGGGAWIRITGGGDRGVLYGAFRLLSLLARGEFDPAATVRDAPACALRMLNHWDNLDRSIERGYSGLSIFDWDRLPEPRERLVDYARLTASLGLNATVLNNVNAEVGFLEEARLKRLASLAELLAGYGIQTWLSVNFAAPKTLGGLPTADPLDDAVRRWWRERARMIHELFGDHFGGFLVKANSEGQPGPLDYGRSHAEGANCLAAALEPWGARVIWRAFVYIKNGDRAREAYDYLQPLDGQFAGNVILQIKNGPLDFQVREAVSPLLGSYQKTPIMLELQVTQEYLGHSTHVCFLPVQWRDVLAFDLESEGPGSTVAARIRRERRGKLAAGIAAVANVGTDRNWCGHDLAQANWYGFGRLAWDPNLEPEGIAREWVALTFGRDPVVMRTVTDLLLRSYGAYEAYTSNLGMNYLGEKGPHFDPEPEIRTEYHGATATGVGLDRTRATGSGYVDQYAPGVARRFEDLATCPEELLLFFHHVPYTYRLRSSGKTVIQFIYDEHSRGVAEVDALAAAWQGLAGRVDPGRHMAVAAKLKKQQAHARVWSQAICAYFRNLSGLASAP